MTEIWNHWGWFSIWFITTTLPHSIYPCNLNTIDSKRVIVEQTMQGTFLQSRQNFSFERQLCLWQYAICLEDKSYRSISWVLYLRWLLKYFLKHHCRSIVKVGVICIDDFWLFGILPRSTEDHAMVSYFDLDTKQLSSCLQLAFANTWSIKSMVHAWTLSSALQTTTCVSVTLYTE